MEARDVVCCLPSFLESARAERSGAGIPTPSTKGLDENASRHQASPFAIHHTHIVVHRSESSDNPLGQTQVIISGTSRQAHNTRGSE